MTDEQILAAYRRLASEEGVFGEPASAAGVAGLLQARERGQVAAGSVVVCTITGNGLKDPATAVVGLPRAGRGRCRCRRRGVGAGPGVTFLDEPVTACGRRRPAPTSVPASTPSAWP